MKFCIAKQTWLILILGICTSSYSQTYDRNYSFLQKVYEVEAKKTNNKFNVILSYNETVDSSIKMTHLDINVFLPQFEDAFKNKCKINDLNESDKSAFKEHSQMVFMDLYNFFISDTVSDPQSGILQIMKSFPVQNSLTMNIYVPKNRSILINEIDNLNIQIFNELVYSNCCDTCNCDWAYGRASVYQEIFGNYDYYYLISHKQGQPFPSINDICNQTMLCGDMDDIKSCEDVKKAIYNPKLVDPAMESILNLLTSISDLINNLLKTSNDKQEQNLFSQDQVHKVDSIIDSVGIDIEKYISTNKNIRIKNQLVKLNKNLTELKLFVKDALASESIDATVSSIVNNIKEIRKTIEKIVKNKRITTVTQKRGRLNKLQKYYVDRKSIFEKLKEENTNQSYKCCKQKELKLKRDKITGEIDLLSDDLVNLDTDKVATINNFYNASKDITASLLNSKCLYGRLKDSLKIDYTDSLRLNIFKENVFQPENLSFPKQPEIDSLANQIKNLKLDIQSSEKRLVAIEEMIQLIKQLCSKNEIISPEGKQLIDKVEKYQEEVVTFIAFLNKYNNKNSLLLFKIKELKDVRANIDSLYNLNIKNYKIGNLKFIVDSVQLEFEAGMLRNIIVVGTYDGEKYKLFNRYPIPFSVLTDVEKFKNILLYEPDEYKFTARLVDIIDYIPRLQSRSDDYAPVDNVYEFTPKDTPKILFKEKTTEILRAKVFTDIIGFTGDQPNGLIQTEVGRHFNLYSKYYPIFYKSPGKKAGYKSYFGLLNYMEPSLLISKIENNNRKTPALTTQIPFQINQTKYAGTLDYFKYMNFYFRPVNINLFSFFLPSLKSSFNLDFGAAWARTDLIDTIKTNTNSTIEVKERTSTVNSTVFNLSVTYNLRPDTRYGFSVTNEIRHWKAWSAEFKQAGDTLAYKYGTDTRELNFIYSFQFNAFFKPFKKDLGELYFRFSYNTLIGNYKENFLQAQLGYAFRLLYK